MDEAIFNLLKFMKETFGDLGPSMLNQEIRELGFENRSNFTDAEKEMLVNRLMDGEFPGISSSRRAILRAQLMSLVKFSSKKNSRIDDQAAIDFLMGHSA